MPVECEHEGECAGDGAQGDEEVFGAVVRDFGDGEEVVGDSGHDMSGFGFIVVAEGEFLEVSEEFVAHIGFHSDAENVAPPSIAVIGGGEDEHHGEEE